MATVLKSLLQKRPSAIATSGHSAASARAGENANSGLAGFNLTDLAEEGRKHLDACRQSATAIIQLANEQAAGIHAQAKAQGYDDGLVTASADNEARIKQAAQQFAQEQLATLHSAVAQLHSQHEQWMAEFAATLTTIALSAAERIARQKLEHEKTILVRWVADAIHSTRAATKLTVAVHPEMLTELGSALDELVASPDFPGETTIVPDESLAMTSVVIRQDGGEIQAGLQAQLQRLSEMLA